MTTPLEIALTYIRRGWNPTPVEYGGKKPLGNGWQLRVIDATNAAQFFNGEKMNIGAVLGPTSHKLTDVDEDADVAIAIGPYTLPRTKARFGRASKRDSHLLYYTELSAAGLPAAIAFDDPKRPKQQGRLIELRIGGDSGAQSVLPGSMHKSGEAVTWEEDGDPATVDGKELLQGVKTVAAYSLLARYWPAESSGHHDTARVVGGFLARAGLTPETVRIHVEAIARAANSPRWRELCRTAEDAATALAAGKHAFGFKGLRDAFGADIAEKVAEWLGYNFKIEHPAGQVGVAAAAAEFPDITIDKDGVRVKRTYRNARVAIQKLGIVCSYDEFHDRMLVGGKEIEKWAGELSDAANVILRQTIVERFDFDPGKENVTDAATELCLENPFDPVVDYLAGLKWDGTPRLETWLMTYMGAVDTPLNREIGTLTLGRCRAPGPQAGLQVRSHHRSGGAGRHDEVNVDPDLGRSRELQRPDHPHRIGQGTARAGPRYLDIRSFGARPPRFKTNGGSTTRGTTSSPRPRAKSIRSKAAQNNRSGSRLPSFYVASTSSSIAPHRKPTSA